jgi:hypothetical protein
MDTITVTLTSAEAVALRAAAENEMDRMRDGGLLPLEEYADHSDFHAVTRAWALVDLALQRADLG